MLEPWGERPDFLRMGILAATIANVNRSRKSKAFRAEDFIPREPDLSRPKEQTPEEQKEAILQMASWFEKRGRLKRKQRM